MPESQLFTSATGVLLLDLDQFMKAAWSDAGLTSKFNSTMMWHTIVTKVRDPSHTPRCRRPESTCERYGRFSENR